MARNSALRRAQSSYSWGEGEPARGGSRASHVPAKPLGDGPRVSWNPPGDWPSYTPALTSPTPGPCMEITGHPPQRRTVLASVPMGVSPMDPKNSAGILTEPYQVSGRNQGAISKRAMVGQTSVETGELNLYPTPRTVLIHSGFWASSPSLRRRV